MSTFGWLSLAILLLAFAVPTRLFIRAKMENPDLTFRELLKPPWTLPEWTWTFPPEKDDPYHDTKLIMALGGIMVGLTLFTTGVLALGSLAIVHHLWYIGYPLLVLSLIGCLAMIAFAGMRLWVDFGRPFKRWWARRHS